MRYLSVCSGIEAATVAWHPLGWVPAAFSEIEAFPRAVLAHHYPNVPLAGDFTKIKGDEYGPIDVLVGGTPCQSFSIAGLRGGLADERGNLALEFLFLAKRTGAKWVVWENVPGVLSSLGHDAPDPLPPPDPVDMELDGQEVGTEDEYDSQELHAFNCFLAGLSELGYGFAYRVLDAQYFGVPQRRRRVIVVGCLGDWNAAAAVLFERHCLQGNHSPSREKRKDVTGTISSRTSGGGGLGTDFELAGGLQPVEAYAPILARCDTAGEGKRQDYETCTIVGTVQAFGGNNTAGSIDLATACREHGSFHGDFESETFLVQSVALRGRDGGATAELGGDLAGAQRASSGGGDKAHVLVPIAFDSRQDCVSSTDIFGALGSSSPQAQAVCFTSKDYGGVATVELAPTMRAMNHGDSNANGGGQLAVCITGDVTHTLKAEGFDASEDGTGRGQPIVVTKMVVRRLTPRECERLQGFPDDHTLVPFRGKPAADGPRYKAIGNSMAVPVMAFIGQRIQMVEDMT